MRIDEVVGESLARAAAAGRQHFPPEQSRAVVESNPASLEIARSRERYHGIGKEFEKTLPADVDMSDRLSRFRSGAAAIHASGAGGGDLGPRSVSDVHLQTQRIASEDAARDVIEMNKCFASREWKSTHDLPGRGHLIDPHYGARAIGAFVKVELQAAFHQLTNKRVWSWGWRIEARSSLGWKQVTSSID